MKVTSVACFGCHWSPSKFIRMLCVCVLYLHVCVCVCVCETVLMCFYCLQFHDFLEVFRICYRFDKQALNLHSEAENNT